VTLRVSFVGRAAPEEDAAWRWLSERGGAAGGGGGRGGGESGGLVARRYEPRQLRVALRDADVAWVHASTDVPELAAEPLRTFAAQGKGVLLTLRATPLVAPLGIESVPPNELVDDTWSNVADEWYTAEFRSMPAYPHIRGLAAYGPHPLVDGLHNGTYCWAPSEREPFARACYAGGSRPADGAVVAVERAYIVQNPERIVAWEYAVGAGRVLCVGAFVHFAAPDQRLRPQLERLTLNALRAVAPDGGAAGAGGARERTVWPVPGTVAAPTEGLPLPEPLELEGALPDPADDAIALAREVEADEAYDLAGRRLLLTGRERSGVREVWAHPRRVAAAWTVTADGEEARGRQLVVTPDVVVRTLETAARRVTETSFVALEHPVAVLEYHAARRGRESVGRGPTAFEVAFTVDLRRMWPFAAGCAGNLRFRRSAHGLVALVASEADDGVLAIFTSRPVDCRLEPARRGDAPAVHVTLSAPLGIPLRVALVAAGTLEELERVLRAVRRLGLAGLVRQRVQRAETVGLARFGARTDEDWAWRSVEWAKRRMDLFLGDVPAVGRSLLAGYGASTPGWGDGRPGYGWFFGRDACWSAFALLAVGEFSAVRQVIRFLGDRQDVSGKVLHEATTSGQFHYDAADSTPLYLLLVARYLAWSGEVEFVRSIWPHVERAYAFCLATDRDGDGLIENADVGHGWIESGPLGGAKVTLYLAAVWRAALEALAGMAGTLGEERLRAECLARAARAGAAVEQHFYDERRGMYALDQRRDGTRTWAQTALLSVPLLLGAANPVRAKAYLDALGSDAFTAPWGVRLLPVNDPTFDPDAYHGGTVWPLFTGWAALAEYRAGRGEAAFRHFMMNASLAYKHQLGAYDEVLHGTVEDRPAGVCRNQAWSAAMVLSPLVEGLLGVEPDAPAGRLTIAPQLPSRWTWLDVATLRCGDTTYDLKLRRRPDLLSVALRRTAGPSQWLTLAPWCDAVPLSVEVDGVTMKPDPSGWGAGVRAAVSFQVAGEHDVRFLLR
jgi:glycogen debranching enzyme